MKTTTEETKGRRYYMVEHDGFVRGEIELPPERVPLYSNCMGVRLMRHLPQPKGYCVQRQGVIV